MKEDLLHFLWRYRRFDHTALTTTEGEPVEIIHPGEHNNHAGPDFINARLQIGDTTWAGNVEMHLQASEWQQHRHSADPAYGNVILHIVMEEDRPALAADGHRIPCLEMKRRIPPGIAGLYPKLLENQYWIPCQHHFHAVPQVTKDLWLDRLLVERLEQKTGAIMASLEENQQNWEQTFYQFLARNFGLKINAEPFEALAKALPQNVLAKHRQNLFQIEALLFGTAGLLQRELEDEYAKSLQKEFSFLKQKYALNPLNPTVWKFLRLHPPNFPTVRIAQFARLVNQSHGLFSKIKEVRAITEIEALFEVQLDGYWLTHYTFDKPSAKRNKSLGAGAVRLLTINTIVPFLFVYGKNMNEPDFKDRALQLLESLPPEQNAILEGWKKLGMTPASAYHSQALLQLKNQYCDQKKCLHCAIGGAILR